MVWGKACNDYCVSNPGSQVTKHVFAQVFREAWIASVKISVVVNGFRESGICPFNPEAIPQSKLSPSLQFSAVTTETSSAKPPISLSLCTTLEGMMKPETLTKYKKRREEGYDVDSADELYCIWSKLNNLQLSDRELPNTSRELAHPDSAGGHIDSLTSKPKSFQTSNASIQSDPPLACSGTKGPSSSCASLDDILVYPDPPKSKEKQTSDMPKHLSGEQMIEYLRHFHTSLEI